LKQQATLAALDVQNTFIAQKIFAVDLNYAAKEIFETVRVERTVRAKYESTNIVVVMMMVMMPVVVPAIRAAFAFVIVVVMAMIVAMVVIVVVIVGRVRVFFCQKLRIDIQDGVEVETADIQQGLDV